MIGSVGVANELIEEVVMDEGVAEPDVMAMSADESASDGIVDIFEGALGTFSLGRASVVDITDD